MSDVKGRTRTRPYRSPGREEAARRTRQAVVSAAAGLFAEQGFAATSLDQVAAAAGVSRPTVFAAFGSKAGLLREVLDQALAGDDEPVPVAQRPWFQPVWDAASPAEVLEAYAVVCTLIGRRAGRVFEVVRRAADGSVELAELWERLQTNRMAGAQMVVRQLRRLGPLSRGLSAASAGDQLWMLNDPGHYEALVRQRGWSERRFTAWLAGQMCAALGVPR